MSETPTSVAVWDASGNAGADSCIVSFSQTLESPPGGSGHDRCLPHHAVWSMGG
jgi:hypothetical protein